MTAALTGPGLYILLLEPGLVRPRLGALAGTVIGLLFMWLLALAVVVAARRIEHRSWASMGIKPTQMRWLWAAIGMGIALSLLVPVLSMATALFIPAAESGSIASAATARPWYILLVGVVTAAVTEEVVFRSYPIETLMTATGSPALSALVPLLFFTLAHANWNLAHTIGVVIPLGTALTLLYLWRRNLLLVIVTHLLIDLPLVFYAAFSTSQI